MSDTPELNVWREAHATYWQFDSFPFVTETDADDAKNAAAAIRSYGDQRDAEAYQSGKLEGARLAIEAAAMDAQGWFPADTVDRFPAGGVVQAIRALSPAKIVGKGDAIKTCIARS